MGAAKSREEGRSFAREAREVKYCSCQQVVRREAAGSDSGQQADAQPSGNVRCVEVVG